jgi:hypothetical protein
VALPRPDGLSPIVKQPCFAAHNTRRYGIPSSAVLAYRGGAMRYSPEFVEGEFSEVIAALLKTIHRGFIAACFDEGVRGSATVPKL